MSLPSRKRGGWLVDLSVIILTRDEEKHIRRCVESVKPFAKDIFVVDSGSTDRTVEIAKSLGAKVVTNEWTNHAAQLNWALLNLPIQTEWVFRLDADEYCEPELQREIENELPKLAKEISGVLVKRKVVFMGRWIRYGGYYPISLLRIFRNKKAIVESRWMDEHIVLLEGTSLSFKHGIVDENLNSVSLWTQKHNNYSSREAVDYLLQRQFNRDGLNESESNLDKDSAEKRKLKNKVYYRMPPLLRCALYFLYRYVVLRGFLDGREGFIWHFLQGFWYRVLVDVKIIYIERKIKMGEASFEEVAAEFGVLLNSKSLAERSTEKRRA